MERQQLWDCDKVYKYGYIDENVDQKTVEAAAWFIELYTVCDIVPKSLRDRLIAYKEYKASGIENEPDSGEDLPQEECEETWQDSEWLEGLDDRINFVFAYGVTAELQVPLSLKTKQAGVVVATGETYQPAGRENAYKQYEYYLGKMQVACNDLRMYVETAVGDEPADISAYRPPIGFLFNAPRPKTGNKKW